MKEDGTLAGADLVSVKWCCVSLNLLAWIDFHMASNPWLPDGRLLRMVFAYILLKTVRLYSAGMLVLSSALGKSLRGGTHSALRAAWPRLLLSGAFDYRACPVSGFSVARLQHDVCVLRGREPCCRINASIILNVSFVLTGALMCDNSQGWAVKESDCLVDFWFCNPEFKLI